MARETDVDTFAIQLKERLGEKFWVEVEIRNAGQEHQLKYFEKKNEFALPPSLARFYLDSDGAELSWGKNSTKNKNAIGHFSLIKMDKLTEIEEDLYGLNNCRCCPPIGFKKDGSIWVADSTGSWFIVAQSFEQYFRINLYYGAVKSTVTNKFSYLTSSRLAAGLHTTRNADFNSRKYLLSF